MKRKDALAAAARALAYYNGKIPYIKELSVEFDLSMTAAKEVAECGACYFDVYAWHKNLKPTPEQLLCYVTRVTGINFSVQDIPAPTAPTDLQLKMLLLDIVRKTLENEPTLTVQEALDRVKASL